MNQFRQYILAVTCAAILCSLAQSLFRSNNAFSAALKLVCGLFMAIVVISPVTTIQLDDYTSYWENFTLNSQEAANTGKEYYEESLQALIKEKTESYILDKATAMGLDISVNVTLSEDTQPVPTTVEITGNISPANRQKLTEQICNELNISKENTIWK